MITGRTKWASLLLASMLVLVVVSGVFAQTSTPEPTATPAPSGASLPAALTWAGVETTTGDFLGNATVVAALTLVVALMFAPRVVRAFRRSIGRR